MRRLHLHLTSVSLFFLSISINVMSEVFQWTDENGQTHFSDRAPKLIQSNNISEQLNNINITSDLSSPEMMLRHEQTKDAEREAKYKKQQEKRNKQPTKSERCKEAQDLLRRVKGRVVFVDEQGKELKVSEEDRKQRAIQLESLVRKLCQ